MARRGERLENVHLISISSDTSSISNTSYIFKIQSLHESVSHIRLVIFARVESVVFFFFFESDGDSSSGKFKVRAYNLINIRKR